MSAALKSPERLRQLEAVIERGQATFIEVGRALAEIREKKLYKGAFRTFEDYCKNRWGWGAGRARQITRASEYATKLVAVTQGNAPLPETEKEARAQMTRLSTELLSALPPEELARRLEEEKRLQAEKKQSRTPRDQSARGRADLLDEIRRLLKRLRQKVEQLDVDHDEVVQWLAIIDRFEESLPEK